MVNQQPEALRLSELLDSGLQLSAVHHTDAAAELRRLHSLNQELLEALKSLVDDKHPECIPYRLWQQARAAINKAEGAKND